MSSPTAASTKSTLSDNEKADDVDDCSCGSAPVDVGGSDQILQQSKQKLQQADQQKQQLNILESSYKQQTTFKNNFGKIDAEVLSAHETDSGFLSGPQSSFQEEVEEPEKRSPASGGNCSNNPNFGIEEASGNPKNSTETSQYQEKAENEKCIVDSGCIEEEYDGSNSTEDGANCQSGEQQHMEQSQLPATGGSTGTNSGNKTMKLKHDVDAGISERFCSLSLKSGAINNLNVAGASTPATVPEKQATIPPAASMRLPAWEQCYQQNDEGDTYLHLACVSGHYNVVAALIRLAIHPCLLNIKNDDGQTPLHIAALTKERRILRMLLLAGAEPTIRNCRGNTALHLACISGDEQCVSALTMPFSASEINEAHRQFGYRSNDKMMSSLSFARLPSDLEIRNYDGEHCVHLAAQAGHIKILSILVRCGANINAKEGKAGRTPLHISIENGNEELFNYLLDDCRQKLNLEATTFARLTAFQFACILKRSHMQNILENHGAEPFPPSDSEYESSEYESDLEESELCLKT